ncbi:MAG: 2-hydroxychromene-2-carboxylate isomerase [Acidobacteria bacterium]|nr:MAG: 2-hydroxychromene-2-carboxylate isomerase [Acidobacteriota bacterium]REK11280.1 MAG: 2-hydroxychromene-2-carboxylate isomerase [Acidobacteriota bacterium]
MSPNDSRSDGASGGPVGGGDLRVDVFFSFRSPYSYLAVHRMRRLQREYALSFDVRVVLPIAVRTPEFFERVNPLWPPYLLRDIVRVAEYEGVPIRWPRPDPVAMDRATGRYPIGEENQPRIWWVSRLCAAAQEQGTSTAFTFEVAPTIWDGGTDDWHEGDHLERACGRARIDYAALAARVRDEPASLDALIEGNQEALRAAGHWGVPTFVYDGEPFFGQDRIDLLVWRLHQRGLRRRDAATGATNDAEGTSP